MKGNRTMCHWANKDRDPGGRTYPPIPMDSVSNEVKQFRSGQAAPTGLHLRASNQSVCNSAGNARCNMNLDEAPALAGTRLTCPHCGRVETDDFELFDLDEVYAVPCDACKRQYHLTISECENCGQESALTWATVPTPGQISLARCLHCGNRFTNHADDIRTVGRGR